MKKQIFNPYMPLNEYVPDGEPHVFDNRVYVYGSHDAARSTRFCIRDYVCYSALIDDLSDWTYHGVIYRKDQDPRANGDKTPDYYAPDVVKGNDGRYYLYYFNSGPNVKRFGPLCVAASDKPEGPYEYYGDIKYKDGTPVLKYLTNDPAVINDNGHIYLYYGWSIPVDTRSKFFRPIYNFVMSKLFARSIKEIKETKPNMNGCAFVELEDDMLTAKEEPKMILDSLSTADKKSPLYNHPFYEAASIRKVKDTYYLVYSCSTDNALAYATSKYPDRDFEYRGLIISNADLGLNGNNKAKAPAGTIHGGFENINGQYYIFYHRCTHNTDFSRQACAEPIYFNDDGSINQVEITSSGLNIKPLEAKGSYPAAIACNLYKEKHMWKLSPKQGHKHPRIYDDDKDVYIKDIDNGTIVGYKYFEFNGKTKIIVTYKGTANGKLYVSTEEGKFDKEYIEISASENYKNNEVLIEKTGKTSLYFKFLGNGKLDLLEVKFDELK